MFTFVLGLFLFLGVHSVSIFAEPLRDKLVAKSELGWKALYSLISLAGLFFIIKGYADIRLSPTLIFVAPYWLRHLTMLMMIPAFILFLAPYFPSRIGKVTRHPQLISIMLWALSHLFVNGNIVDLLLFGSFLVWAMVDIISMRQRQQRKLTTFKASGINDLILVVVGLLLYGAYLIYLHGALIGVPLIS
ncbi:MAG: NnrU family protein [Psychromonas sp.]|nr:NnrU family protein [Alteromonadales bacterium]MCP5077243.1 NnrU family protein [Psychromonas sp.]